MCVVCAVSDSGEQYVLEHNAADADRQADNHDVTVAGATAIRQEIRHRWNALLSKHLASPAPVFHALSAFNTSPGNDSFPLSVRRCRQQSCLLSSRFISVFISSRWSFFTSFVLS